MSINFRSTIVNQQFIRFWNSQIANFLQIQIVVAASSLSDTDKRLTAARYCSSICWVDPRSYWETISASVRRHFLKIYFFFVRFWYDEILFWCFKKIFILSKIKLLFRLISSQFFFSKIFKKKGVRKTRFLWISIAKPKVFVFFRNYPFSFTLKIFCLPVEFFVNIINKPVIGRLRLFHETEEPFDTKMHI